MNARRKAYLRERQYWRAERDKRAANKGEAKITNCQRCGKPFMPEWLEGLGQWQRCCNMCRVRNLSDALDMPTHPAFIDKHTKHPVLTVGEFHKLLNKK